MIFRLIVLVLVCGTAVAQSCGGIVATPPRHVAPEVFQGRFAERGAESEAQSAAARTNFDRFRALPWAAQAAYELGEFDKAASYATEMLELPEKDPNVKRFSKFGSGGMATFYGHLVQGRLALKRGDVASARRELLLAGATTGAPVLNSFGPNMALANDLLTRPGVEQADHDTVLQFLAQCRVFWECEGGLLNFWSTEIAQRKSPEFGVNLSY